MRLLSATLLLLGCLIGGAGAAIAAGLETAGEAVVTLRAQIPHDARTAQALGTERAGSGVVIDDAGLVLTIGYLILEASDVEIETRQGDRVPADIVAYDYDSGFGLVRTVQPLDLEPVALGDSDALGDQTRAIVASADGARSVMVVSRREFAGYWEYLLDDAIFTGPPYRSFSGAALLDFDGKLAGIGSLYVGDASPAPAPLPGNMFVPINKLKPILGDLLVRGRASGPRRPWIGAFTNEAGGRVFVSAVVDDGPAARAGLRDGDIILAVGERPVRSMAELFRHLWAEGEAGVTVTLRVLQGIDIETLTVQTEDRYDWLRLNPTY